MVETLVDILFIFALFACVILILFLCAWAVVFCKTYKRLNEREKEIRERRQT